jgi:hypothetical protein
VDNLDDFANPSSLLPVIVVIVEAFHVSLSSLSSSSSIAADIAVDFVDDAILFRAATAELFDIPEDVDAGDATAAEVPLVDFLRVGVALFRVTAVLVVDLDVAEPTENDGDDAPDAATADVDFGEDDVVTATDDLDLAATRASCHAFAFAFASIFASVRLFFFGVASPPLSPSVEALTSILRFTIVAWLPLLLVVGRLFLRPCVSPPKCIHFHKSRVEISHWLQVRYTN